MTKRTKLTFLLAVVSSLAATALPKVAVLDIIAQNGIDKSVEAPVTESIMEEVVATRAYVVLDRSYIEQTLKEQEFDVSLMVSDTQAAKAGQFLGADYVVAGKVQLLGDAYFLVAKMIEVRTGVIVAQSSEQGTGKLTTLLDMARAVGRKVVAGAPISPLQPGLAAASPVERASFKRIKVGMVTDLEYPKDLSQSKNAGLIRIAEKNKDWMDLVVVDRTPPKLSDAVFERLAGEEACDIVFSGDWGYQEQMEGAAARHPKTIFECMGGQWKDSAKANFGVFGTDEVWFFYLSGLVAGSLTSSGKVGFLSESSDQGPWVTQIIDYFSIGVKAANPKAVVYLSDLPGNHWDTGEADLETAKTLIAQGCDIFGSQLHWKLMEYLAVQALKGKRIRGVLCSDTFYKNWPNTIVSGPIRDFGYLYDSLIAQVRDGTWNNQVFWPRQATRFGGGEKDAFNPAMLAELKSKKVKTPDLGELGLLELLDKRWEQISTFSFEPFTGPLKDQKGKVRLIAGVTADGEYLTRLDWLLDNVKLVQIK
jgi:basic membrane protein A and related proteins